MPQGTKQNQNLNNGTAQRVFLPFCEALVQRLDAGDIGELVPFSLDYRCVRLMDGTYEFSPLETLAAVHNPMPAINYKPLRS